MSTALAQLKACRDALAAWREGRLPMAAFCQQARSAQDCLEALPERYAQVWHNLLDRLESSALFAEESCSFSQTDLVDGLSQWLDQAEKRLSATPA